MSRPFLYPKYITLPSFVTSGPPPQQSMLTWNSGDGRRQDLQCTISVCTMSINAHCVKYLQCISYIYRSMHILIYISIQLQHVQWCWSENCKKCDDLPCSSVRDRGGLLGGDANGIDLLHGVVRQHGMVLIPPCSSFSHATTPSPPSREYSTLSLYCFHYASLLLSP